MDNYTLDCKLAKMSTNAQSVSTTLKRRRVQADEEISNDSDLMKYRAAGLRRLLESVDGWEDGEYLHLMHNNTASNDLTLVDPEAYSQLQHALNILPAEPQLDALVEAFFSNINHHYNIIHPPTFIRQYISWAREKPRGSYRDVQLTTLILMMCACVTQHLEVESKPTCGHSASSEDYHRAGQNLAAAIPAGFYHITNIQWKVLSICWFKGEAKFTEAWHTIGLAVQEAYELGLHQSRPSRMALDTQAQIGRQAWRVLYCWNWQLSSTLGRPLMMPDIDSELEPLDSDLKNSSPTPTLHTRLQYQLISSLAKRWQTPQDIDLPSEIKTYKGIVDSWISTLPSVFSIHDPDTSNDATWPWVVAHRYYIQTMAHFILLQPYKAYLSSPSTDLSSPETQELLAEAVNCSLKALQAASQWASLVLEGDGQFHLIVLCLFDTAAFLSTTLDKDQSKAIPHRNEARLAVDGAATILQQLQTTSHGAKSSYKLLRRILRRLKWNGGEAHFEPSSTGSMAQIGNDGCAPGLSSINTV